MLVASAEDEGERYAPGDLKPPPRFVARTAGAAGGSLETVDGARSRGRPLPSPAPRSTPTARGIRSPPA